MPQAKVLKINTENFHARKTYNPSLSAKNLKPLSGKGFKNQKPKTAYQNGIVLKRFTPPVILPKGYKSEPLSGQSEWTIVFSFRKKEGQPMVQVKKRIDINRYSGREKIKRAEFLREVIHNALKTGYNPFELQIDPLDLIREQPLHLTLLYAFNQELPAWSDKTVSSYLSSVNRFLLFLKRSGFTGSVNDFTRQHAKSYSDYLLKEVSLRTHNNRLAEIRTFFGYLYDREIIDVNPFDRIKKKRAPAGGQLPFSQDQLAALRASLDRPALLFLDFAIDSLLRSSELENLKVGDIHFQSGEVAVLSNIKAGRRTKDKQSRYVKIKPEIMKRLHGLVEGHGADEFVFGAGFKPSAKRYKRDGLSRTFTELLRSRGYGEAYSLYSCRHTGTIMKWKIDKWGAEELMNQLGHSDFGTTQRYLTDTLGVYRR